MRLWLGKGLVRSVDPLYRLPELAPESCPGRSPNPGSGRELQVWKGVGEEVVVSIFPQGGVRRGHSVDSPLLFFLAEEGRLEASLEQGDR